MKRLNASDLPFELRQDAKFSVECPACADTRKKKGTKSLFLARDPDGFVRGKCMHGQDCEYGNGVMIVDPYAEAMPIGDGAKKIHLTPMSDDIPAEYLGNKVYAYKDSDGNSLFGVIRFDTPNGKIFAPYSQLLNGKITAGKGATFPDMKTLYRQEHIGTHKKILVVEGEKAADAAAELFKDNNIAVVSWRGGSNGVKNGNWDLLATADTIYLWPDNDDAGKKAMGDIARLIPHGPQVKIVDVSAFPAKSDLADNLDMDLVRKAIASAKVESASHPDIPFKSLTLEQLDIEDSLIDEITSESGFDILDAKTPLPKNGLVVVEARSGHLKTTFSYNVVVHWLRQGKRVVFFNMETTARRVFRSLVRIVDPYISMEEAHTSKDAWEEIRGYVSDGLLHIYGQDEQLTGLQIAKMLDSDYYRGALVVVDYVQIVDTGDSYLPPYKAIKSLVVDPFRKVVNRRKMLMILISQLTEGATHAEDKAREAKDIHLSAEMVIRLWNKSTGHQYADYNTLPGTLIARIHKNRNGVCGVIYSGRAVYGAKIEFDAAYDGDFIQKAQNDRGDVEIKWRKRLLDALERIADGFGSNEGSTK